MAVADVRAFWERVRSFGNTHLQHELWIIVNELPQVQIGPAVLALGAREGFRFSSEDYRLAVIEGTKALPEGAHELAVEYRQMVAEGRWFEVIDGVVVGG